MNTIIIYSVFLFLFNIVLKEEPIIYDLPENVTHIASEYIYNNIAQNGQTDFVAQLNKINESDYMLYIIISDFKRPSLLVEKIISKTNRMLRINDELLLPLITEEDFLFAYIGSSEPRYPGGDPGRKRIHYFGSPYTIVFNLSGEIIKVEH